MNKYLRVSIKKSRMIKLCRLYLRSMYLERENMNIFLISKEKNIFKAIVSN